MLKIRLNIIVNRHARKNAAEEWKGIAAKVYVSCSLNFILWCMFLACVLLSYFFVVGCMHTRISFYSFSIPSCSFFISFYFSCLVIFIFLTCFFFRFFLCKCLLLTFQLIQVLLTSYFNMNYLFNEHQ